MKYEVHILTVYMPPYHIVKKETENINKYQDLQDELWKNFGKYLGHCELQKSALLGLA